MCVDYGVVFALRIVADTGPWLWPVQYERIACPQRGPCVQDRETPEEGSKIEDQVLLTPE
ncbi:hypothetical protein ACFQ3S_05760 [Mucilaginibacter terrae]|uniref:hypothetical protein n=1 Tax=Mucilaginibacter terrae TaxID=1955052 RepID=UPI00362550F9